jgi:hypothetical protein
MAVLWTLAILALCWLPIKWIQPPEQGSPWFEIPDLDKVIHWGVFVVFALLWLRLGTSRWRFGWVALGGLAMAVGTELVQAIPFIDRDCEIADGISDMIGVSIGLLVAPWIEPVLRYVESWFFPRSNS